MGNCSPTGCFQMNSRKVHNQEAQLHPKTIEICEIILKTHVKHGADEMEIFDEKKILIKTPSYIDE